MNSTWYKMLATKSMQKMYHEFVLLLRSCPVVLSDHNKKKLKLDWDRIQKSHVCLGMIIELASNSIVYIKVYR